MQGPVLFRQAIASRAPSNPWSQVATVFTNSETRLYSNGKLVETAPGSELGEEAPFVIGNAGAHNLINFYRGQIRPVRISEGERYSGKFESNTIETDENAVLVLDNNSSAEGDELLSADGKVAGRVERY